MTESSHPPSPEALLEHREWLRAIARSLVRDESAVDDVEQRTWLAVLRNRRPVASVRAWLRSVVRNAVIDSQRSEARRRSREGDVARSEGLPPTGHLVLQLEAQRAVAQAVSDLPEPYRTTVLLRHIEELSVKDVATRMATPVPTVHTRLRRAHALLRQALDAQFGDRRAWCLALLPLVSTRPLHPIGAATGGALMMAAKMKLAAVAAVVLALAGGAFWLVISTDDTGSESASIDTAELEQGGRSRRKRSAPNAEPVVPETHSGSTVNVEVVDTTGQSISDARVELRRIEDPRGDAAAAANADWYEQLRGLRARATTTAPDAFAVADGGTAQLAGIADGTWRLHVSAPGFASREQTVVVASKSLDRRVTLQAGCALRGRVVDMDGDDVRHADVYIGNVLARADERGRFRVEGLTRGAYDLRVGRPGGTIEQRGEIALPDVTEVILRVAGGCAFRGRVVDDVTGEPIRAARVVFQGLRGGYPRYLRWGTETTTDRDGRFAWHDLPPGQPFLLAVTVEGYAPNRNGLELSPAFVELLPGRVPSVEVRMRRGGVVRGRVLAADGSPIGGAVVDALTALRDGRISLSEVVVSDGDGTFELRARRGATMVRVRVSEMKQRGFPEAPYVGLRDGDIPASCRAKAAADDSEALDASTIEVVMDRDSASDRMGVLSGFVQREDGESSEGIALTLDPARRGADTRRNAVTTTGGKFRFDGLRGGAYIVHAVSPGCAPASVSDLSVAGNGVLADVEVVLARELTISGRVVDTAGAPIRGAEISLIAAGRRRGDGVTRATTAGDGAFMIRRLPPGEWQVAARRGGFVEEQVAATSGTADVEIQLEPALSITGLVVNASTGDPISGVPITAEFSAFRQGLVLRRSTATDSDGRFRLTGLAADTYRLWVGQEGDPSAAGAYIASDVDGVHAGAEDVRIELIRGLLIEGQVLDSAGDPVRRGRVSAYNPMPDPTQKESGPAMSVQQMSTPGMRVRSVQIARDGSFRLAGLAPGMYAVEATPSDASGQPMSPVRITRIKSGTRGVVLRTQEALVIEGRLLLEDGSPLPRQAQVEIRERTEGDGFRSGRIMLWSQTDGSFRTSPLKPDRMYDIVVSDVPGSIGAIARGIRAGTRGVDLVIRTGGRIEGRVLDQEGRPVQTRVRARVANGGTWPSTPGDAASATSDLDGHFVLRGLRAEPYAIEVGGTPSEFLETRLPTPVDPGATGVEVRVAHRAVVSGRLVDAAGSPHKGGAVQLMRHGSSVFVDDAGRFAIRGVVPGRYPLFLRLGQRIVELGDVDAPSAGLEITVPDQ